jgi:hypothetical protein
MYLDLDKANGSSNVVDPLLSIGEDISNEAAPCGLGDAKLEYRGATGCLGGNELFFINGLTGGEDGVGNKG